METGRAGSDDAIGNSRGSCPLKLSSVILRSFVLADLLLIVRTRERLALGDILNSSQSTIATARDSREQASGLAEIAPSDSSHRQDRKFRRKFSQHASGEIERGQVPKYSLQDFLIRAISERFQAGELAKHLWQRCSGQREKVQRVSYDNKAVPETVAGVQI